MKKRRQKRKPIDVTYMAPIYNGTAYPDLIGRGAVKEYEPSTKHAVRILEDTGIRLELDAAAPNPADLLIERQPWGWMVFVHAESGGDPAAMLYIEDALDTAPRRVFWLQDRGPQRLVVVPASEEPSPNERDPRCRSVECDSGPVVIGEHADEPPQSGVMAGQLFRTTVLRLLHDALTLATEDGVLDDLAGDIHPDVANQFCDAVAARLKELKNK